MKSISTAARDCCCIWLRAERTKDGYIVNTTGEKLKMAEFRHAIDHILRDGHSFTKYESWPTSMTEPD